MPWQPLNISDEEAASGMRRLRKKAHFLVDHNVDEETATYLRGEGWNVVTATEAGVSTHADEDIFAFALREDRILLTHDKDFLDDRRFPPHRNPGVVILPGASGNTRDLVCGLLQTAWLVAPYRERWRHSKLIFNADWSLQIRQRDKSGTMVTRRYRFTRHGPAEVWSDQ